MITTLPAASPIRAGEEDIAEVERPQPTARRAGKTMLLKLLAGQPPPQGGERRRVALVRILWTPANLFPPRKLWRERASLTLFGRRGLSVSD